jgi:glycosyltransferase involved in cell wall biosynthesis
MKITVVTISFNQGNFLRQCIDSVLIQNYSDIEYIIVDPGSTDGSREIIESYGDRVIRLYGKDAGPADGLNKGFAVATGDVFYFINSDDYVLPGAFEKAVRCFQSDSSIDVVLAGGLRVNSVGTSEGVFYPSNISAKAYVNGAVTLFQQGMFFKAELFRRVNGFNFENKSCWDGELLFQFILKKAKFKRLMELVAVFRIYPESITGSQRFADKYNADQSRMFKMVYGDDRSLNKFHRFFYRFKKLFCDPVYLYKRIAGKFQ